jgi:MEMO1 family protein
MIHPPSAAGAFYPLDVTKLDQAVDALLTAAAPPKLPGKLVAMLVPHAGYQYSGAVAANGYRRIGKEWETVILIGPFHHGRVDGAALWPTGMFQTALGSVPVDNALAKDLLAASPLFHTWYKPHLQEHSLDVQLPFLQKTLGRPFKIVPILMNSASLEDCRQIGHAIARIAKLRKTLIVISSDLSHYPDSVTASRVDHAMLDAMQTMNPAHLHQTSLALMKNERSLTNTMCGETSFLAGLYAAKELGANAAVLLKYANSGEIPSLGDPKRVVGYGAVALVAMPTDSKPKTTSREDD